MVLNKIPTFGEVKSWVNNNADVPNADYADDSNTLQGNVPDDLSGVNYIQSGTPTYKEGATWLNTDNNILYVGFGGTWKSTPPIQVTDESTSFDSSNATISLSEYARVLNGSVKIVGPYATPVTRPPDENSNGWDDYRGVEFTPKNDMLGVRVAISSMTSGVTEARLQDSGGSVITTVDLSGLSSGDTFEVRPNGGLSAGTTYQLVVGDGGGTYTGGFYGSSPTRENSELSMTNGVNQGTSTTSGYFYQVQDLEAIYPSDATAEVTIEWPSPDQISSWELGTYHQTPDGETVTVDIEDNTGTTIYSDIDQHFGISSVSPDKNIRFKVSLSRTNTSNNPTIDYVARRLIR